jgi:hypothetical protein
MKKCWQVKMLIFGQVSLEVTDLANTKLHQLSNLWHHPKMLQTVSQEILTQITGRKKLPFQNKITTTTVLLKIIHLL